MRVCKHCGVEYELGVNGGRHKYCSEVCAKAHHQAKWSGPGRRDPRKMKDQRLRREFGISLKEFDLKLSAQNNQCACCANGLSGGRETHVDHCHTTGKIRDILCSNCNQALGLLREDENVLLSMIEYIRKHNAG